MLVDGIPTITDTLFRLILERRSYKKSHRDANTLDVREQWEISAKRLQSA